MATSGAHNLNPFSGAVEAFDLQRVLRDLDALPDIKGAWPKPASISRFGWTKLDWRSLRRFEDKISFFDMGHKPEPDSVWAEFNEPCWLWTGGLHNKGYGRFYLGKDPNSGEKIWSYSHRTAFEHWVGIPKPGYIVDHECEVKTCCNPVHLWPQSNAENIRLADLRRPWQRRNQYSKE